MIHHRAKASTRTISFSFGDFQTQYFAIILEFLFFNIYIYIYSQI